MSAVVAVVGEGILAELVCEVLTSECRIVRLIDLREGMPEDVAFVLVLNDAWHPAVHNEIHIRRSGRWAHRTPLQ